jgi:hypothetical protein
VRLRTAGLILVLLLATRAFAWGPHPEITDAGISALGKDHPLRALLGAETAKLREHCWMADVRRSFSDDHYPDDYLIFPAATKHYDHLCPEVKTTYEPYFRRALQALRTENAANAARWVGSILHFTEDTGSPPHAAEIRGDVHSKMENWVDAKKIRIDGYAPQLLGADDDAAVAGFLRRMDGLISFSKERGLRLRKPVEAGERAEVEPVVLESALETSRVVADLLHTLGTLAAAASREGATLRGRIASKALPGLEKVGAKVMIDGTHFSTLSDAGGAYEFRNLPAGKLRLLFLRAGNETAEAGVLLEKGGSHVKDVLMSESGVAGSLVRNGDFRLRWANPKAPDCWYRTKDAWEGEPLPVAGGRKYRLRVEWNDGAKGDVQVRWREHSAPQGGHPQDDALLAPGLESRVLTVPEKMGFGRILIHGTGMDFPCAKVALTPEP